MLGQEGVGVFPATFSIQRSPLSFSEADVQDELLRPAEWILEAVGREFKHLGVVQIQTDSYRDAVGMLFAKAVSTFVALVALARIGHEVEASHLSRSLMNLAIDLMYMSRIGDREENAQRFMDFGWMEAEEILERARKVYNNRPADEESLKAYEAHAGLVSESFEGIRSKFEIETRGGGGKKRRTRHWAQDETIAERAEALGSPFCEHYLIGYRELSAYEHSSQSAALHYKRFPEQGGPVVYMAGPSRSRSHLAMVVGCEYLLHAFLVFGEAFDVNVRQIVEAGKKLIDESYNRPADAR